MSPSLSLWFLEWNAVVLIQVPLNAMDGAVERRRRCPLKMRDTRTSSVQGEEELGEVAIPPRLIELVRGSGRWRTTGRKTQTSG